MSATPNFPDLNDPDAQETSEWLDALEGVIGAQTINRLLAVDLNFMPGDFELDLAVDE